MSSPPSGLLSAGPAVPPIPAVRAAAPRPPRTWHFIGLALFGAGICAVLMIAELATFIVLFVRHGVVVTGPSSCGR